MTLTLAEHASIPVATTGAANLFPETTTSDWNGKTTRKTAFYQVTLQPIRAVLRADQ